MIKNPSKMRAALQNLGSVISVGENQCLGFLFHSEANGVFDATYGKVEVSREGAEAHNRLLSDALIKGLDENCQIGQCGVFYLRENPLRIVTWIGDEVSDQVTQAGAIVTFRRNGKTFRGRAQKDSDMIRFRRIN